MQPFSKIVLKKILPTKQIIAFSMKIQLGKICNQEEKNEGKHVRVSCKKSLFADFVQCSPST